MPTCVMGSKVEDAVPSRRRLCSVAHWRLLLSNTVQVAGQKWTVACSQLSNSDTLASGPAESPVGQRIGLSSQSAMCGRMRVAHVVGVEHPLTRPPNQNLSR